LRAFVAGEIRRDPEVSQVILWSRELERPAR
jgi:hypothetical protein